MAQSELVMVTYLDFIWFSEKNLELLISTFLLVNPKIVEWLIYVKLCFIHGPMCLLWSVIWILFDFLKQKIFQKS